jgi:hypothetical protein
VKPDHSMSRSLAHVFKLTANAGPGHGMVPLWGVLPIGLDLIVAALAWLQGLIGLWLTTAGSHAGSSRTATSGASTT